MKHAILSIAAGLTTLLLSLALYLVFRADMVERTTVASINTSAQSAGRILQTLNRGQSDGTTLASRLEAIARKTDRLAILAAVDSNRTIVWTSKNKVYVPTASLYDSILDDFIAGRIPAAAPEGAQGRYYSAGGAQGRGELKFYCHPVQGNGLSYLMVFAYDPERAVFIRFILEIVLLIILNVSGALLLFLMLRGAERPVASTVAASSSPDHGDPETLLEEEIRHFFSRLAQECDPDRSMMYLLDDHGDPCREYRYERGKAIAERNGEDTSLDTGDTPFEALRSTACLLSDGGKRAYAPVIAGESLIALVAVDKETGITGSDITIISRHLQDTAPFINDYRTARRLLMDDETGLYSRTFCDKKLEECRYRYVEGQEDSTLVLLDLDMDGSIEDMDLLIKATALLVRPWLPPLHYLCRYDRHMAVILPGMSGLRSHGLTSKLAVVLGETRVRISETMLLPLKVRIGIASASTVGRGSFINLARADMDVPKA